MIFSDTYQRTSLQRTLSRNDVQKIVDVRLKEVDARLAAKKISLDLHPDAKSYLGSVGYSPIYGARPLNRAIQQELLNPLAKLILEDRVQDGDRVRVSFDGPHNRLYIHPNHEGSGGMGDAMEVEDDDLEIEEMD